VLIIVWFGSGVLCVGDLKIREKKKRLTIDVRAVVPASNNNKLLEA
jgi:hypothetical protein